LRGEAFVLIGELWTFSRLVTSWEGETSFATIRLVRSTEGGNPTPISERIKGSAPEKSNLSTRSGIAEGGGGVPEKGELEKT